MIPEPEMNRPSSKFWGLDLRHLNFEDPAVFQSTLAAYALHLAGCIYRAVCVLTVSDGYPLSVMVRL